ncbi:GvpL/GvpF family gas vesicle protein [Streptomyces radicis]|uniref:Gas vesicle protein n=1 Tax=Streptomyces radicis TaxID=1750517 RepID=A0A3A9W812_9ACTN|nr:GvpL/GvpF family gas vesicle protein [Streptomyces radicis]RKN09371.1 gas vesicle protein [Streptomyces radicis]RKN23031.1 gas vesicle protein [Streptomyces radicis]
MTELTEPATSAEPSTATYVFAVCRATDAPALATARGHGDGGEVRALPAGTLAAVVQEVPTAAHDEEALRRRLSERTELERYARAHHEVVAAVCEAVTAVPLPLATLYRGEERARRALAEREARFHRILDRVEGCAEWGVKVWALARPSAPGGPEPATGGDDESPAGSSGRAYLERLRGRQRAREARQHAAWTAAERVDAALRPLAVASRRLRAQGQDPAQGGSGNQLLNAAYLVRRDGAAALATALRALNDAPDTGDQVRIEVTGPWAPYSFADGTDAADETHTEAPDGAG